MKVWIVDKGKQNEKEVSRKLLSYIYCKEKGKIFNFDNIKYGKYGKPYYEDNFFYNISHSKKYVCIANSTSEVGIDIEEERKNIYGIEKKILTAEELKKSNNKIIEYWVIKEAYSKYKGKGLNMPFNKISTSYIKQQNINIYNLSTTKYYCYVIGTEPLEKVEFVNITDLIN